jgi:hypothetical protein
MMLESEKENVIISGDRNNSLAASKERLVLRGWPRVVYPTSAGSFDLREESFG